VTVRGGSTLVLSGCLVRGGSSACRYSFCGAGPSPQQGGIGLEVISGDVHALDTEIEGGPGSYGSSPWGPADCLGPVGPAHSGTIHFLAGRALRVTPLAPTRENETATLHVEGPPHVLVRLGASDRPATVPYLDLLRGTLLLAFSSGQIPRTLGVTNASGVLDATLAVGPLRPGVETETVFYQVFHLEYDRWRVRPIGQPLDTFVLGQGTMLLGLDESF
jgi:hypothetical protein